MKVKWLSFLTALSFFPYHRIGSVVGGAISTLAAAAAVHRRRRVAHPSDTNASTHPFTHQDNTTTPAPTPLTLMSIQRGEEDRNTIEHHYALAAQPLTTSSPMHPPSITLSKDAYTQSSFEALSCTPENMAPQPQTTIALSPIKSEDPERN